MDFEINKTYSMMVIYVDAKGRYVNVLAPDKKSYRVDIEGTVANGIKSLKDKRVELIYTGESIDVQPNFMLSPKYFARVPLEPKKGSNLGLLEGLKVEFKKSIIFSSTTHQPGSDKLMEIAREIAAFMNTEGGILYCGVDDEGNVVGIENDLKVLGKVAIKGCNGKTDAGWSYEATADGFSQKLRNLIRFFLGDFASTLVQDPEFLKDVQSGHTYVKVKVNPATDEFVYLGPHENVYYRTGTSSVLLEGRSREQYAKARFGMKSPLNPVPSAVKKGPTETDVESFSASKVALARTPRSMQLPKWIDDMIFGELGATYCRSCCDMTVVDWNRAEIKKYLGTYFPRSYVESFCLYSDYFQSHLDEYKDRKYLSVFDFGCGTGGEILGFLDAVEQHLPDVASVKVRALDGNHYALRVLERIVEHRKTIGKLTVNLKTMPVTIDDFYDLGVARSVIDDTFDFFMTFKAVCELVTKQQFEENNPYTNIIQAFSDILVPDGKMLIADVSTKNGTSQEWLPKMLDVGIMESSAAILDRNEGFNETFVVSHSHFACDQSKIAWRFIEPSKGVNV